MSRLKAYLYVGCKSYFTSMKKKYIIGSCDKKFLCTCGTMFYQERTVRMIKVGIIGATGYAGGELVRILAGHRDAQIIWYGSRSYIDQKYADVYRNMFQIVDAVCMDDNMEKLASQVDVIFTATPQGLCASLINEEILSQTKVIDLSADFRIKDVNVYEEWYKIEHKAPQFIEEAVYGLCEINREAVRNARLVANPGCYTTCSILTAYPLAKEGLIDMDTLIIDAKSGTSGAGRGAKLANLYCEVNENMKAYGVATHRHTPEIEEQLGYASGKKVVLNFTPHLVPHEQRYPRYRVRIPEKRCELGRDKGYL